MKDTTLIQEQPEVSRERDTLKEQYLSVRQFSEALAKPLQPEDMVVQTVFFVSPTKWHLAHTSWFFETFVLQEAVENYENPVKEYPYLFNSYYQAAGPMHCRAQRGLISRPTVAQVMDYRAKVDEGMLRFMKESSSETFERMRPIIETGIHHEQQHQELLLMDIKHVFAQNPLYPAYVPSPEQSGAASKMGWKGFEGGVYEIGHKGEGFHYDNEEPRHKVYLQPFQLADRLVTCGEYLEFIGDGGYENPQFWHSLGWNVLKQENWQAPLYWEKVDGRWTHYTLGGRREVNPHEPACHVSFFEAAAYARWARARLPDEAEWEVAARDQPMQGNFVENELYHPTPAESAGGGLRQIFGDVWEWTRSSYAPYPGYEAAFGALGEYNGKFMCNQYVLRGGACVTSQSHIRPTYRNFFQPEMRWQFSGIRLARDTQ